MAHLLAAILSVALALSSLAAEPDLPAITKQYKLDIVTKAPTFPVKTAHGPIGGTEADTADVESYATIFAFEWSLYPTDLVRKTQVKGVVFCKDLSFAGQKRTAVPDFEHDTLYLDVSSGRHDDRYVRKVIHHEFFHFVDLRDDGKLYEDERWVSLNPSGFKYGRGGAKLQSDHTVTKPSDEPGFLNRYATAGVEEDKAEVFAHMMVEPKLIAGRVEKDEYMRAKVERMRELLAAFSRKVDKDFWAAVEKVERPEPKK